MTSGRFVLLGHPLGHSLSPVLHQAAYDALGLAHSYELVDCPGQVDLAAHVSRLRAGEYLGANVTLPWKGQALGLADSAHPSAGETGAANVLQRSAAGLVAYNTDVSALQQELARLCPAPRRALVIGSGGAARAATVACRRLGARVEVAARRFADDDRSAQAFRDLGAHIRSWSQPLESELIVQATSAGMSGADSGEELAARIPWSELGPHAVAYDVVYRPEATPFVEAARAAGVRTSSGIGMLVGQALAAMRLWLGTAPPRLLLLEAARAALAADEAVIS